MDAREQENPWGNAVASRCSRCNGAPGAIGWEGGITQNAGGESSHRTAGLVIFNAIMRRSGTIRQVWKQGRFHDQAPYSATLGIKFASVTKWPRCRGNRLFGNRWKIFESRFFSQLLDMVPCANDLLCAKGWVTLWQMIRFVKKEMMIISYRSEHGWKQYLLTGGYM